VPWRNGGGFTREVLVGRRSSECADQFGWRISIATIELPGPFSSFPGLDRTLCVLSGEIAVHIEDDPTISLDPSSAPLRFRGEAKVEAAPASDAIVLNLIVDRRHPAPRLDTQARTGAAENKSLFMLAREPMQVSSGPWQTQLNTHDAILADRQHEDPFEFGAATLCIWLD
jgi:environmental stress-induced protein Ves